MKEVVLSDVIKTANTGLDAIRRAPIVAYKTDIRCLRIQDISQKKDFNNWGYTKVSPQDFEKYKLLKNDIIMARTCSTGISFFTKENMQAVFNNGLLRIRADEDKVYPLFLYYVFKSKKFENYINGISSGTSVQLNMKIGDLIKYSFTLPNLDKQKNITNILKNIDDKITLNTQTNQTLEQIAQATFKHWFIDFTPVHAKANALARGETIEQAELAAMACLSGKTVEKITALKTEDPTAYHQLQQTAAAFPSEFVETEMGQVPKGWEYKFLNEVCKIAYGKNLPTKQLLDQGYPVFGGNGIIGYFDRYLYEQPQTLISCRGAASGKIMYSAPKSFITNNSLIIESNELLDYFYIYEYLKNKDITPYISGSAQPQITISSIEKIKILLPQDFILERYSSLVSNLYNKIYLNNKNNELLAKTRDQLLPKLLNGEIEL